MAQLKASAYLIFFVFIFNWPASQARAVVSLSTSATAGYFRDDRQETHVPLYTQINFSGIHAGGIETYLDVSLNNDFYEDVWRAYLSQAMVVVPLSDGFWNAPYRKSRFQAGRQLLAEGFDLALLDGIQIPVYWSHSGGIWLYGGFATAIDMSENRGLSLAGASLFQDLAGFLFRGGYSAGQQDFADRKAYGSVATRWDRVPLEPQILIKGEWDLDETSFSQGLAELELNPFDSLSVNVGHSYRKPRRISLEENIFLYRILARSPEETEQVGTTIQVTSDISVQVFHRQMHFQGGMREEWGQQQAAHVSWALGSRTFLVPSFHHTQGYGGELWDSGILYKTPFSDKSDLRAEFSAAQFDRVNHISGWAYQARNGIEFLLGPRFTAAGWLELERNHLFEFDARVFANVAFYQ